MKQKCPRGRRRARTPAPPGASAGERPAAELVLARELGTLIGKHLAATYAAARDAAEASPATTPTTCIPVGAAGGRMGEA